ncbi:MAG: terminase, partial [Actinomycetia bacterium]|nr:terminase [Actinomycetes bacterium]
LLVRKTLTALTSSGVQTFEDHVIPDELASGRITYFGGSLRQPAQYRYPNGSRIMLGGLEHKKAIGKVMSTEYDTVFVQEAIDINEDEWEALTTRLRNNVTPQQQLLADTNPDRPDHWLKQRCNQGKTRLIEGRHEDNPTLYTDTGELTPHGVNYMGILDNLTGVRHDRLRLGLWVSAEGMIYLDYNPSVHLVDQFPVPTDWARYWAVDFGYTNPFVCQFWAVDPDGRHYLYREIYRTRRRVDQHAAQILDLVTDDEGTWTEPQPLAIIADHDAEAQDVLRQELQLFTVNADKRVAVGIEAGMGRLALAGDGRPRVYFMRDALVERDPDLDRLKLPCSTVEEITGYIWAPGQDGKPNKEEPVKLHDHGMDALRYHTMFHEIPTPRFREFGG